MLSKLSEDKEAPQTELYLNDEQLGKNYSKYPHLLRNALQIMESCNIKLPEEPALNLQTYTGSREKDIKLLRKLCDDGLSYRYPQADFKVCERIEKELQLIDHKNFVSYFLINWDIVNYAQKRGYFYVGRGVELIQ